MEGRGRSVEVALKSKIHTFELLGLLHTLTLSVVLMVFCTLSSLRGTVQLPHGGFFIVPEDTNKMIDHMGESKLGSD